MQEEYKLVRRDNRVLILENDQATDWDSGVCSSSDMPAKALELLKNAKLQLGRLPSIDQSAAGLVDPESLAVLDDIDPTGASEITHEEFLQSLKKQMSGKPEQEAKDTTS